MHMHFYITAWTVRCDCSVCAFCIIFCRESKACRIYICIPIFQCKRQDSTTKRFLKYDLPTQSSGCHYPDGFVYDYMLRAEMTYVAEVKITLFATCHHLSCYGPSARTVNASASAQSNTESDVEIHCFLIVTCLLEYCRFYII